MGLLRTRVTALTKDGHTMQQQQQYPHYYHYFLLFLLLDQRPKTCSDLIASIERERERERVYSFASTRGRQSSLCILSGKVFPFSSLLSSFSFSFFNLAKKS